MKDRTLIVEISGKRPGTKQQRPTEKNKTEYPHIIISNNSEGYDTDWEIVNVPKEYEEWYKSVAKTSDNAWYAPMNRSYAIKYAREHGYRYLVQLDDNIQFLEISYVRKGADGINKRYRAQSTDGMLDDYVDTLVTVLKCTNAAMAGCNLAGVANPCNEIGYITERFCYSIFALDVDRCPDLFQGDFEDDVEFRLKLKQMGVPSVQVVPLRYSKTGQAKNKDLTGCRKAYAEAGVKRGEHMRKLYGNIYSCGMRSKSNCITLQAEAGAAYFKHILKPFKVGVLVKDKEKIDAQMRYLFKKWAKEPKCSCKIKEKRVKG